jgi:DNA-binding NarL/FixJ family response regulator
VSDEITIVIADDHPIVRKGLRQVIEEERDLKLMAEANDGKAGLELIQQFQPQIAILDLDMPQLSGFEVAQEIHKRRLAAKVIFMTIHSGLDLLYKAMDLGAQGYVLKESALVEIVDAVRYVVGGRQFVSPSLTPALLERRSRAQALEQTTPTLAALTPSERRILNMIASGKPTKLIATDLHIHPRTVETHRGSICQKLQLTGANSLLRYALEHKSELLA